jgi:maltose O-acetyltransferase
MKEVAAFLRSKLRDVPVGDIAFGQLEAFVLWLVGGIPGVPGFAVRTVVLKVFCAELAGIAWVQPGVTFVQLNRLRVGKQFAVNSGTYINAIGTITIGNDVLIGSNVTISSGQHPIEGRLPAIFARPVVPRPIVIEDDVWIGAGAVIMPGITLRQGTVVGANSVVTKDTEAYAVMAGVPAKKLRSRDPG